MKKENCMKRKNIKNKLVTIRVSREQSEWIRRESFSPTNIFNEALRALGYGEEK